MLKFMKRLAQNFFSVSLENFEKSKKFINYNTIIKTKFKGLVPTLHFMILKIIKEGT